MGAQTGQALCLLVFLVAPCAALSLGNFAQGNAAFKAGQYERALAYFELADREGEEHDSLGYNTAVTLARLGRYELAEQGFQSLLAHPQWSDMARFQLGVLAEKQGKKAQARLNYRQVSEYAKAAKLRALADSRLAALGPERDRERLEKRSFFLGKATAGYDSNPNSLYNDLVIDSAGGSDNYLEGFAWGKHTFAGDTTNGWRVSGSLYSRNFQDLDALDLDILTMALHRDFRWREWEVELGVSAMSSQLDSDTLTNQAKLLSRLERNFGRSELVLSYQPRYHDAGSKYGYLEGWQHVAQVRWEYPLRPDLRLKATYRLDYNHREDLKVDQRFSSNSPTRQGLRLALDWRTWHDWEFSAGLEYRNSDYSGTNRFQDTDGINKEKSRSDNRLRIWAMAEWRATSNLRVVAKVQDTDNDSNWDRFTYNKEEASLAVMYLY